MASPDGTSRLKVGQTRGYRMGMDTELLAIDGGGGAAPVSLFVLCGERFEGARLFRSGGLSVHMIRVEGHPVSMASCTVGDHQWMLARDALVARLDARVFIFELPGFFYAVVVQPNGDDGSARKCGTLAEIFSRFCAYQDISTAEGTEQVVDMNQHPNSWVRAHARIQRLRTPATTDAPAAGATQMERAVRTSAVVKLLSRSLLAGALQPSRHLSITLGGANASTSTTAALPGKSVVSDLLDAVETNRTAAPGRDSARRRGQDGLGWWCLNVEGVMLLMRVIQAGQGRRVATAAAGEKRRRGNGGGEDGGLKGGGGGMGVGGGGAADGPGSWRTRWARAGVLEAN